MSSVIYQKFTKKNVDVFDESFMTNSSAFNGQKLGFIINILSTCYRTLINFF